MGRPTVELELDPKYARDLYAGGVFVTGCSLRVTEECDLLLRGAAGEMLLGARVVFVDPTGRGAGLEVVGFGPEMRQRIADLAVPRRAPTPPPVAALQIELDPPRPPLRPEPEPEPEPEPRTTIEDPASYDVDVDVDADDAFAGATEIAHYPVDPNEPEIVQDFTPIEPEPEPERAPARAPAPMLAIALDVEPELDAGPAMVYAAPPPPDDDLELAPEVINDVSPGSALDFAYDPALEEVQTYELERDIDLVPAVKPTLFEPGTTQPISLADMDDDDAEESRAGDADPLTGEAAPRLEGEGDVEVQGLIGTEGELSTDADDDTGDGGDQADTDGVGQTAEDIAKHAPRLHERMRGLTLVQQLKYAHTGEMQERILLERIYGKAVWEALLRNPRITGQEVARIARMGALPRPLIEIIVGNGGWLQVPEVRRALLTHPRLMVDQVVRILRLLPKHELKLAMTQTAYPMQVREHARRIVRGS